jgi:hypothetical protein
VLGLELATALVQYYRMHILIKKYMTLVVMQNGSGPKKLKKVGSDSVFGSIFFGTVVL